MVRANCASGKQGENENTPGNHEIYLYKIEIVQVSATRTNLSSDFLYYIRVKYIKALEGK